MRRDLKVSKWVRGGLRRLNGLRKGQREFINGLRRNIRAFVWFMVFKGDPRGFRMSLRVCIGV